MYSTSMRVLCASASITRLSVDGPAPGGMYRFNRRIFPPQSKSSEELPFTFSKNSTKTGFSSGHPPGTRVDRRGVGSSALGPAEHSAALEHSAGGRVGRAAEEGGREEEAGASRERADCRLLLAGVASSGDGELGDRAGGGDLVGVPMSLGLVPVLVPVRRRVNRARPAQDPDAGSILRHGWSVRWRTKMGVPG
eukprot:1191344-Prorocentrum_minimum.AAC.1